MRFRRPLVRTGRRPVYLESGPVRLLDDDRVDWRACLADRFFAVIAGRFRNWNDAGVDQLHDPAIVDINNCYQSLDRAAPKVERGGIETLGAHQAMAFFRRDCEVAGGELQT